MAEIDRGGIIQARQPPAASGGDYFVIERAGPLAAPQDTVMLTVSKPAAALFIRGVVSFENTSSDANLYCRINGDTGSNYEWWQLFWTQSALPSRLTNVADNKAYLQVSRGGALAHAPDQRIWFELDCLNPGASDWYPSFLSRATVRNRTTPLNESSVGAFSRRVVGPIVTLTFFDNFGSNFSPGSQITLSGTT